jgi:transcriptional regulator with XRE-family HTH domain
MNIKNLLGEKVKRLRKMRGFTQEQFAEMIDITPRNLCRIESGENFVTVYRSGFNPTNNYCIILE